MIGITNFRSPPLQFLRKFFRQVVRALPPWGRGEQQYRRHGWNGRRGRPGPVHPRGAVHLHLLRAPAPAEPLRSPAALSPSMYLPVLIRSLKLAMFGCLFGLFIGQRGTQFSCTKNKTLPDLRLPISSDTYSVVVRISFQEIA